MPVPGRPHPRKAHQNRGKKNSNGFFFFFSFQNRHLCPLSRPPVTTISPKHEKLPPLTFVAQDGERDGDEDDHHHDNDATAATTNAVKRGVVATTPTSATHDWFRWVKGVVSFLLVVDKSRCSERLRGGGEDGRPEMVFGSVSGSACKAGQGLARPPTNGQPQPTHPAFNFSIAPRPPTHPHTQNQRRATS